MTSPVAPRRRTLPALLATALLAAAALLVPALPAAAHDELVSTDPSADTVLEALPAEITFTYSADVLTDPGATVVQVTDASGASLTSGAPVVDGSTVVQPLAGPASGAVSVLWRVVSSDGHPIDGSFSFTVPAAAPTPTATATPTSSPAPSASQTTAESAAPTSTPDATAVPADTASEASPLPWILLVVALVLVAAVIIVVVVSRGRRRASGGGSTGTPAR